MLRARTVGLYAHRTSFSLSGGVGEQWLMTPACALGVTPIHAQQFRHKGTTIPTGSSQVDRRTTKKIKTKKGTILQQKDKKLAAIRDSKNADEPRVKRKKKTPSLLAAAGIKQKKELMRRKSRKGEEDRPSRLSKPLGGKKAKAPEVEIVGDTGSARPPLEEEGEDRDQISAEINDYLARERAYLEEGKPLPQLHLDSVVDLLREEKAENMVVLNVADKCNFAKHMVIVEGRSVRHMQAMAEMLIHQLKSRTKTSDEPVEIMQVAENTRDNSDWLSVDTGEALVHFFSAGARRYYDLDELWINKGTVKEELARKLTEDDLDPLPDLEDVPGGWNPFDQVPAK